MLEVPVLRADDLLVLRFTLVNLRLAIDGGARVERADPEAGAWVVVAFQSQHVGERAFFESDDPGATEPLAPLPVRSALAGESRLAFRVPDDVVAIPYTLADLLDWSRLEPSLPANALPAEPTAEELAGRPRPASPAATETALELPYRLVLSPTAAPQWCHATAPRARGDRVELWHTRLTAADGGSPGHALRAVWSPDLDDPGGGVFPVTETQPLYADWRATLVRLSGDFSAGAAAAAIDVRRLALSALGATMDVEGHWPQPGEPARPQPAAPSPPGDASLLGAAATRARLADARWAARVADALRPSSPGRPLELEAQDLRASASDVAIAPIAFAGWIPPSPLGEWGWIHRTQTGRDGYVEFDTPGLLFPLGHLATLVTITERRLERAPSGRLVAALRQRNFIRVTQPFRDYSRSRAGFTHAGLELPFTAVRFTTTVTPNLDKAPQPPAPFFPTLGGAPYKFHILGTDHGGGTAPALVPQVFVPFKVDTAVADQIAAAAPVWAGQPVWQVAELPGVDVALAEPGDRPGATTAAVHSIRLGVAAQPAAAAVPPGEAPLLPAMIEATVSLPALAALGGPGAAQRAATIAYPPSYLQHGFDPAGNRAQLFAALTSPVPGGATADRGGGVAAPTFDVDGLSRALGPIADSATMAGGTFDPDSFLPSAKLLGALDLRKLMPKLPAIDAGALAPADLDALRTRVATPGERIPVPVLAVRRAADAIDTLFAFKPDVTPIDAGILKVETTADSELVLTSAQHAPIGGAARPTARVDGSLSHFTLDFAGVILVRFGKVAFSAAGGAKPDLHVEGVKLEFAGALRFVQTLQDLLPPDGFADPPYLRVLPTGVTAGTTVAIPTVGVGIVSIEQLALDASVSLPFTGDPAGVRFALSSREHPFLVTVSLFAGGGFFAARVSTSGPPQIEAALEFGGNFSLDIGVASGNVHVMAGIYFGMLGSQVKLTGYFRLGGSVEVLGLICVSVEFYLGLTYDSGKAYGEASLTVSVEVAFFSTSVSLHVERKLAGAAGDPTFAELVDLPAWTEHCAAYAD